MDEIQQDKPATKGRRVVVDPAVSSDAPADQASAPKRRTRSAKPKTEGESAPAEAPKSESSENKSEGGEGRQNNRDNNRERSERNDQGDDRNGRNNRNRNRNRDRNRNRGRGRGGDFQDEAEPEISEDDVLVSVAGILDVLENYAFIRTSGYLPGPNDVYVSLGQVKKYGLRKGDAVVGAIRQPREGEGQGRQKFNAVVRIDSVNGQTVAEAQERIEFGKLTPLYPQTRLRLETDAAKLNTRIIDLVAPIG